MGKKYLKLIASTVLLVLAGCQIAKAQNASDVLRYSLQYPEGDPVSMIMPATSYAAGFGSYQQNPASAAFFKRSFVSIGVSDRYVNEEGTYIFNTSNYDDNQFTIGDVGFVYKLPTSRGKFVIGAGYSQSSDFNRALSGLGYNEETTITDHWANLDPSTDLSDAAYNAFAIDDINNIVNGKKYYLCSISVFRGGTSCNKPYGKYPGIFQNFNLTKGGVLGEYSAFMAVEIAKNLEVGVSIGGISGNYHYKRHFLESDTKHLYEETVIDSNGDGVGDTDVDHILTRNEVNSSFSGFTARLGFIYQVSPHFNIGAAYQFKNVLHINEDYSTHIKNTLDNGDYFKGKDLGKYNFKVVRPARLNIGITAKDISGFTISASAQRVAYSSARIKFNGLTEQSDENYFNHRIDKNFNNVFNFRVGLAYQVTDKFTPRIGYGYYPSPTDFKHDYMNTSARNFFSAGFSARLSSHTTFNAAAQLGMWKDHDILYSTPKGVEVADESVKHWNVMAGFTFYF